MNIISRIFIITLIAAITSSSNAEEEIFNDNITDEYPSVYLRIQDAKIMYNFYGEGYKDSEEFEKRLQTYFKTINKFFPKKRRAVILACDQIIKISDLQTVFALLKRNGVTHTHIFVKLTLETPKLDNATNSKK